MQRGLYISGGAHALFFAWLMVGGLFEPSTPEVSVADVTVLSEAEFAALSGTSEPEPVPEPDPIAPAPEQPIEPAQPPAPDPVPEPTPAPTQPPPEPAPTPAPQPLPDPVPAPAPIPVPEPPAPLPVVPEPEPAPEPISEPAPISRAPETSLRPKPRPAPRVAPEATPEPSPDAVTDPETRRAASPDAESPDVAETQQEETAPPETATEIVTEAEEPSAPSRSLRPKARPQRVAAAEPTPPVAAEPEPEPEDETADAIAAALAAELAGGGAGDPAPSGPPLTGGERDALRLAVQDCWQVDVGSEAANVTVVVGMDMEPDGRVVTSSLRLIESSGGSGSAVEAAYSAARRAVLICGSNGYDLPADKYDHWREIEMVFNPAEMRTR